MKETSPTRGTPEARAAGCVCGATTKVWPYGYSGICAVHKGQFQSLVVAMRIRRREDDELDVDY